MSEEEKKEMIELITPQKTDKDYEEEIERLNKELEKYKYTADELNEIERLNNIINELEKELDLNLPFKVVGVRHLKKKLQELKGSDKE